MIFSEPSETLRQQGGIANFNSRILNVSKGVSDQVIPFVRFCHKSSQNIISLTPRPFIILIHSSRTSSDHYTSSNLNTTYLVSSTIMSLNHIIFLSFDFRQKVISKHIISHTISRDDIVNIIVILFQSLQKDHHTSSNLNIPHSVFCTLIWYLIKKLSQNNNIISHTLCAFPISPKDHHTSSNLNIPHPVFCTPTSFNYTSSFFHLIFDKSNLKTSHLMTISTSLSSSSTYSTKDHHTSSNMNITHPLCSDVIQLHNLSSTWFLTKAISKHIWWQCQHHCHPLLLSLPKTTTPPATWM